MSYDLIELCCGTAALTFHVCGAKAPVSMAGSKKMLAPQLVDLMRLDGAPGNALLVDQGEWGVTYGTLFGGAWDYVADVLEHEWGVAPERDLFDVLRTMVASSMSYKERAAAHLWLQSRTFRGKEVHPTENGWKTHGFDPEFRLAAKNSVNTKDRGWYNSRPALAKKLRELGKLWRAPRAPHVSVSTLDVRTGLVPDLLLMSASKRIVEFIDPPYRGREAYRCELPREDVVQIAKRDASRGIDVYVAEGEPIAELVAEGWQTHQLRTRRMGTQLSKVSHEEWITYRRAS